jgi:hypothetical protein
MLRARSQDLAANSANNKRMTNAETEIAGFLANHKPKHAKLAKAVRAELQARLPGLHEIVYVYARQATLLFTFSPTEHGHEGVCSVGVNKDGVKLHFGRGAELEPSDTNHLLQGSGKTVRHVVLNELADFKKPAVQALIDAALKLAKIRLQASAKGSLIIKAEEQRKRALRAAKTRSSA